MTFLWPKLLWLLALVPLVVAGYLALLARRKRAAARYANLGMLKDALGAGPRFRRHVPPILFLLALVLLIAAIARPVAIVTVPAGQRTIMLAMDVSGSMRAKDVEPTRLAAAQQAARAFLADLPRDVRVGVVAFAGTAAVVQAPTQEREDVVAALERFQLQRGTAVASGIIVALATIFPDDGIDVTELILGRDGSRPAPAMPSRKPEKKPFKPVPPGSSRDASIVLLSDGQRTTGPEVKDAVKLAAERGVRVFTVGVGTPKGEVLNVEGWSFRARLDEDALKTIANETRGQYFYAGDARELRKIYEDLSTRLVFERKQTEITALFCAAAAVLALVAAALSLVWFNRIL